MKSIILFLLFPILAFSQIKIEDSNQEIIGEYKLLGTMYAKIVKQDNVCVFVYRDEKFTRFDSYKAFAFNQNDLDAIYSLFTDFSKIEKGSKKVVQLENGDKLLFEYKSMFGKIYADVTHQDTFGVLGKVRYLTNSQLKNLFGK